MSDVLLFITVGVDGGEHGKLLRQQKAVNGMPQNGREERKGRGFRQGFAGLPFGYGLGADMQLFSQLLLG
ncbi:hypothetical protein D3C80_1782860 [compost metagenome]